MPWRWKDDNWDDIRTYVLNDLVNMDYPPIPKMDYSKPTVKRVIFNPPATIILWTDGTKSVVKCQNGEWYDPEKGFALAYLKKLLGNDNTFNKEINKWVDWSMYDE